MPASWGITRGTFNRTKQMQLQGGRGFHGVANRAPNRQTTEQAEYRRSIHDYFATPAPITEALLKRETFDGLIWEIACGEGWMSEVLKQHGYEVLSTDLIDRGYGTGGVDFLKQTKRVPNIITNPPFLDGLWFTFTKHALKLATGKVALLLPTWCIEARRFLELRQLKAFYPFIKRVGTIPNGNHCDRSGNGKSITAPPFAWVVFDKAFTGKPTFEPIFPPPVSRMTLRFNTQRRVKRDSPATTASVP